MTKGLRRFWKSVALPKTKKAYEVITLMTYKDLERPFLHRYLVVSISITKAISMIRLRENEKVLEAKEMTHELVLK